MVNQETVTKLNPQQTAQAILIQISEHPETFDVDVWENVRYIGGEMIFTRCVAGWADFLHNGEVSRYEAFDRVREYLGLSFDDAHTLFYGCLNRHALSAMKQLAAGEAINWSEVFGPR